MFDITRGCYKVPEYEGGRIPIHNIDGGRNTTEVSYIFNLPSLREVRYERERQRQQFI